MTQKIVTRFAPSPTGYLHVGGARTALFNYLAAGRQHGAFLLRIEDTDLQRSSGEMTEKILEGLRWLDIKWEGPLVHQASRRQRHLELAAELLNTGKAYRCFCTPEMLQARRKERKDDKSAQPEKHEAGYDGTCRRLTPQEIKANLAAAKPFAIRFKMTGGETGWDDIVHGRINVQNNEMDDFVLVRSNGTPVYQLAVVVDDHDMGITQVIRGDDHISNTPRQILLYRAFGWQTPEFAHLPLILGSDKKRLSKRHGAASVEEYQRMGILPEALFNYLALLGWNPGDEREVMSPAEIMDSFRLEKVNKRSAVFDPAKLLWMNARYIAALSHDQLYKRAIAQWQQAGFIQKEPEQEKRGWFAALAELLRPRLRVLNDLREMAVYFFKTPDEFEEKAFQKHFKNEKAWQWLQDLKEIIRSIQPFNEDILEQAVRDYAEQQEVSAGKIIHPLRLALTGRSATPGLFEVMVLLGREAVLERLTTFLKNRAFLPGKAAKTQESAG
ncbi:MAG: glutamate--tRNA ligase [Calditrichia bacterium]